MPPALTGTVTFLFTDVERSPEHSKRDEAGMAGSSARHDACVREAVEARGGQVFATGGDGLAAVFARAADAVQAAVRAQVGLVALGWGHGPELRVRMGLHTGEAHERDGDYLGSAVNCAARVMEAANGGQVLATATAIDVAGSGIPDDVAIVDVGEHLLRGIARPVRLLRLGAPGLEDRRPPRTGSITVGNLPILTEPLRGRDADLQAVLFTVEGAGLLTVVGPGGIGKTRFALQLAHELRGAVPDGAWLARLDGIGPGVDVVDLLLGLFGIDAAGGERSVDVLVEALRHRRALLVLDNCEHVLPAAAAVAEAITVSCPHLRLVATSRRPLRVAGERVVPLGPLDTSDGGPAVTLFLERAAASGARIDPRDGPVVGRICRRLDGVPLAIELAAARARTLETEALLDRLDDMGRVLQGRRHGPERHGTLHAAIDWSFRSLDADARSLLERLSVFAGSFGFEAVREVAGRSHDVLDPLDDLLEHSLVVAAGERSGERFRLLEPIRQYAAAHLDPADAARTRHDHATFYAQLLFALDRRWRGGDDQGAWPAAQRELPDLRLAFARLCEQGRIDDAQRFAVAGWGPILMHVDYVPQSDWAPRSLALDPHHVGPYTASACAVAAWGALSAGDHRQVEGLLRRGADALRAGSIDDGLLFGAAQHAIAYGAEPDLDHEVLDRCLADARASGDLFRQVLVLAHARSSEAIPLARELGSVVMQGFAGTGLVHGEPSPDPRATLEDFWEIAERAHSFGLRNSTGHVYASYEVCFGAPLDGLLFLRPIVRDWMLRGDARVWENLHTMAAAFARLRDRDAVEVLLAAIGDRPLGHHVGRLKPLEEHHIDELVGERGARKGPGATWAELGPVVEWVCDRAAQLAESAPAPTPMKPVELTARQLEVARLVARGFTNKDIARRLEISRYTVETHVRNILERLDATSRTQIATWFLERR